MPEGPELYITASYINKVCRNLIFGGPIVRSPVHKCDAITWIKTAYTIRAESRGKELMLHLSAVPAQDDVGSQPQAPRIGPDKVRIESRSNELMLHQSAHDNRHPRCLEVQPAQENTSVVEPELAQESTSIAEAAQKTASIAEADKKTASVVEPEPAQKNISIVFTFGMSGKFVLTPAQQLLKHSHLAFLTKHGPELALSFVDPRRFGRWAQTGHWSANRGPCVIQQFDSFVDNIVASLDDAAFKKPICELLLDQKYFNGIGNYLRAEILFRCGVPPFVRANSVLQLRERTQSVKEESGTERKQAKMRNKKNQESIMQPGNVQVTAATDGQPGSSDNMQKLNMFTLDKLKAQEQLDKLTPKAQELLKLCHSVPLEVVHLGTSKYMLPNDEAGAEDKVFEDWLQCYNKPNMSCMTDHNKRTIWFSGPAGPLVPHDQKPRTVSGGNSTKLTKSLKTGNRSKQTNTQVAQELTSNKESVARNEEDGMNDLRKSKVTGIRNLRSSKYFVTDNSGHETSASATSAAAATATTAAAVAEVGRGSEVHISGRKTRKRKSDM